MAAAAPAAPFLCRFHHWGWAASGVGVLDLEEWSPESAPGFQGVGGPQGGRPPTQPPNPGLRDPGLLLQDSRTPAPHLRSLNPGLPRVTLPALASQPHHLASPVARGCGAPRSGVFTVEARGEDPHSGQVRGLCGQMPWEALPLGLGLALSAETGRGWLRLCPVLGAPHKAAGHPAGMPPAGVHPTDSAETPTLAPKFPMGQERKASRVRWRRPETPSSQLRPGFSRRELGL